MHKPLVLLLTTISFSLFAFPQHATVNGSLCTINNRDFKEFRYPERIPYCQRNVTYYKKVQICRRDGVLNRKDFTVDHMIPLALGGDNSDNNLWCQHKSLDHKDVEYELYERLLAGEITQIEAIETITSLKLEQ